MHCHLLTQMDNFGKLHMTTSSVLVDATDSEAVVAFARHAVAGDLSGGAGLCGETLLPLLGAHFFSLQHKDGAGGCGAVGGRNPAEKGTVGPIYVHLDSPRADGGRVSGS